jgi:hypothetical protein
LVITAIMVPLMFNSMFSAGSSASGLVRGVGP